MGLGQIVPRSGRDGSNNRESRQRRLYITRPGLQSGLIGDKRPTNMNAHLTEACQSWLACLAGEACKWSKSLFRLDRKGRTPCVPKFRRKFYPRPRLAEVRLQG